MRFSPLPTPQSDPELHQHRHLLYFAFFNALNWQVATGTPMVLFMEYLGANSFQTGLVYGWALLLTPVQVFATMLLPRVGFKRLTLAGWGARSWFLLVPLGLALAAPLPAAPWMITAMVGAMFCYSLSRSVGAAAITTWMHALIPDGIRGRYWSTDQIMAGVAAVGTLVVSVLLFAALPARWAFFVQYAISITGAWLALRCLRRLPDVERPRMMSLGKILSDSPRHMFASSPFRPYLWLAIAYFVVTTPVAPFGAYFLKAAAGVDTSTIMFYAMLQYGGVIAGNWFMRSRIDRTGAKPFFRLCFLVFAGIAAGWLACLRQPSAARWVMPGLYFLLGVGSGTFTAANVSYLAKLLPPSDRALPVSLHGALTAFLGGLSPVLWGMFLKGGDHAPSVDPEAFRIFFWAVLGGSLALVAAVGSLEEKAGHVDPLLGGGWLLRPFRAMTNLINLVEPPRRRDEDDRAG
ncbi:MAG TPA: hypothetical protein VEB66_15730 [Opitutaceae bacterium]|nr:hypothetical protein [Opitutaceae bacterium]